MEALASTEPSVHSVAIMGTPIANLDPATRQMFEQMAQQVRESQRAAQAAQRERNEAVNALAARVRSDKQRDDMRQKKMLRSCKPVPFSTMKLAPLNVAPLQICSETAEWVAEAFNRAQAAVPNDKLLANLIAVDPAEGEIYTNEAVVDTSDGRKCAAVRSKLMCVPSVVVFPSIDTKGVTEGTMTLRLPTVSMSFPTPSGSHDVLKAVRNIFRQLSVLKVVWCDEKHTVYVERPSQNTIKGVKLKVERMDERAMQALCNNTPCAAMETCEIVFRLKANDTTPGGVVTSAKLADVPACTGREDLLRELTNGIYVSLSDLADRAPNLYPSGGLAIEARDASALKVDWSAKNIGQSYSFASTGIDDGVYEIQLLGRCDTAFPGDGVRAGRAILERCMNNAPVPTVVFLLATCKMGVYERMGFHYQGSTRVDVVRQLNGIMDGTLPIASNGQVYPYGSRLLGHGTADRLVSYVDEQIRGFPGRQMALYLQSTVQWHDEAVFANATRGSPIPSMKPKSYAFCHPRCSRIETQRRMVCAMDRAYRESCASRAGEVQLTACNAAFFAVDDADENLFVCANNTNGKTTRGARMGTVSPDFVVIMAVVVEYIRREHEGVAFADIGCGIGNILLAMAPFSDELYGWDSNPDLVRYRQALLDAAAVQMQSMCVQSHIVRDAYTLTKEDDFAHVTEAYPGVFWMNDHAFDLGLVRMLIDKLARVRKDSVLLHFQFVDEHDAEFFTDITTWMPTKTYIRGVGTDALLAAPRVRALKEHVATYLKQRQS